LIRFDLVFVDLLTFFLYDLYSAQFFLVDFFEVGGVLFSQRFQVLQLGLEVLDLLLMACDELLFTESTRAARLCCTSAMVSL
jgi:hypothetical protein